MKTSTKTPLSLFCLVTMLTMAFETSCFGQDTIITRNGNSIIGRIVEVTTTEVKYKKEGIADGPLYIEDKSGIDRIHYKNGFTDIFPELKPWQLPVAKVEKPREVVNFKQKPVLEKRGSKYAYDHVRLSENQLYRLLLAVNNPEVSNQVRLAKRSRGLQYIGFAAAPFVGLSMLSLMAAGDVHGGKSEENASKVFLGCAAACLGTSIYFKTDRKRRNAEAVRLYKQKFE
jgi:hypothetical protein